MSNLADHGLMTPPPQDTASSLTLRALDAQGDDSITILCNEQSMIGRGKECVVVIDHESVSKAHATIDCVDGAWRIEDHASTNGTTVNSIGLDPGEVLVLHNDDQVTFGTVRFTVECPRSHRLQPTPDSSKHEIPAHGTYMTRASLIQQLATEATTHRDAAWSRFHDVYAPLIRGFAQRAGAPNHHLDDLVQEVTIAFFKSVGQFEYDPSRGRFRGYLKTCTINAMRRRWRKEREKVGMNTVVAFLADEAVADAAWSDQWSAGLIEQAIESARIDSNMEPRTWDAFELYGRRGVPAEEVGRRLEMSPETVRRCKSRVAEAVRATLLELRDLD